MIWYPDGSYGLQCEISLVDRTYVRKLYMLHLTHFGYADFVYNNRKLDIDDLLIIPLLLRTYCW